MAVSRFPITIWHEGKRKGTSIALARGVLASLKKKGYDRGLPGGDQ
jgi:hypothetical protein